MPAWFACLRRGRGPHYTPQVRTAPRQPLPAATPLVHHAARRHSLRELLLELEVRHGEAAQAAVGEAGAQHVPVPAGAARGAGGGG